MQLEEEKEVIIELLRYYQQYRCLWHVKSDSYSDRDSRNEAYNKLLEVYRRIEPNATLDGLKKKIENMRSAYRREMRKVSFTQLKQGRLLLIT